MKFQFVEQTQKKKALKELEKKDNEFKKRQSYLLRVTQVVCKFNRHVVGGDGELSGLESGGYLFPPTRLSIALYSVNGARLIEGKINTYCLPSRRLSSSSNCCQN